MKRLVTNTAGFVVVMMLTAAVKAGDSLPSDNPYGLVVARNVFGLNPPPPPGPVQPADPPPKITPNGIMSIFGTVQALFKVTVTIPGQPAKDKSYMLSEGQREDDIEVTKIDEKNAIITFDNHGTVQELPLANGQASGGDAAPGGAPGGMPPRPTFGGNRFGNNPAFNNAMAFRNRALANSGGMNNNPANSNNGFGGTSANNQNDQPLSPEAQAIMIEANRAATEDLVRQGKMPPLPPTAITPPDAAGGPDGAPLIVSPPTP